MAKQTVREASKADYTASLAPTMEEVNLGSLQRIADAAELMASNYRSLIRQCNDYERMAKDRLAILQKQDRQIAALKGVITRMKRQRKEDA